MIHAKSEKYGQDINSYDMVKFLAISIMIVDHIGFFFFPEQLLWRAIGRICVPMWFFMVGYSKAGWKDKKVIGGMLLLIAVDIVFYSPIFSLNVLVTITLLRLVHQVFLNRYLENLDWQKLLGIMIMVIMLYPITSIMWEYGTLALLFSIGGFLVRQGKRDILTQLWFLASAVVFCAMQAVVFKFSILETAVMTVGIMLTSAVLFAFEIKSHVLKGWATTRKIFLFIARNSLTIYVIHWIILLSIVHHLHPESYQKFQWIKASEKKEVKSSAL